MTKIFSCHNKNLQRSNKLRSNNLNFVLEPGLCSWRLSTFFNIHTNEGNSKCKHSIQLARLVEYCQSSPYSPGLKLKPRRRKLRKKKKCARGICTVARNLESRREFNDLLEMTTCCGKPVANERKQNKLGIRLVVFRKISAVSFQLDQHVLNYWHLPRVDNWWT